MGLFSCKHCFETLEKKEIYGLNKKGKKIKEPIMVITWKECIKCGEKVRNIDFIGRDYMEVLI